MFNISFHDACLFLAVGSNIYFSKQTQNCMHVMTSYLSEVTIGTLI